ncbi:MAG: hypothetical protein ABIJ45_07375 [Candidatus Zixiibacteriota bacterium]
MRLKTTVGLLLAGIVTLFLSGNLEAKKESEFTNIEWEEITDTDWNLKDDTLYSSFEAVMIFDKIYMLMIKNWAMERRIG